MTDPARRYAPGVRLVRRHAGPVADAGADTTIEAWLLGAAIGEDDLLLLFRALVDRLLARGYPLDRASLHIGTLHPDLFGFAWVWNRGDDLCDEIQVPETLMASASYRNSPLAVVIEQGRAFRRRLEEDGGRDDFSLLADLRAEGITDYLCLPLGGSGYHNAVSLSTRRPGGFGDAELAELKALFALFALHVERHILLRLAGNVLDTYLGRAVSREVLAGSIKRGSGKPIRAVVWMSDLRGFTDLSDRLAGSAVTAILNAYFECLVAAMTAEGGEVLKFIGDGLLAVFPFDDGRPEEVVAASALAAAERGLDLVGALNADPPAALTGIAGWRPLRSGIALHEGEVFFGNVGGPERLDFTVIGRAVNEAARVEALSKTLGQPLLITEPVAARLSAPLQALGAQQLRGRAAPIALFTPASRYRPPGGSTGD